MKLVVELELRLKPWMRGSERRCRQEKAKADVFSLFVYW